MNIGGVAAASGSGSRSQSKRDRSLLVVDGDLAVEHQERADSLATAAAMPANRRVWSRPLRLTRRTRSLSLYASIRQPSTFSS